MTVFYTREPRNLSLAFVVNGKLRPVTFTTPVLYGNVGNSTFTAHDSELAKAMKESPYFNTVYYVKEEREDRDNTTIVQKPIEDELCDPKNPIIVETVTTKGMAAAYIQGMYGETFTATSVEEMKREAARKWNILFPNWGKQ